MSLSEKEMQNESLWRGLWVPGILRTLLLWVFYDGNLVLGDSKAPMSIKYRTVHFAQDRVTGSLPGTSPKGERLAAGP